MAVDEDKLTLTVTKLRDKLQQCYADANEYEVLINKLAELQKVDGALPIDPGTGVEITTARRDIIYDAHIDRATKIISPPAPSN